MQKNKQQGSLPPGKRNGSKQEVGNTTAAPADGRKQWLTRKDIEKEYDWCAKTTRRMEKDGTLIPTIVGHNGGRVKRYFRPHIETLLHNSFVSIRAVNGASKEEKI